MIQIDDVQPGHLKMMPRIHDPNFELKTIHPQMRKTCKDE
jgi:hypothetical protein